MTLPDSQVFFFANLSGGAAHTANAHQRRGKKGGKEKEVGIKKNKKKAVPLNMKAVGGAEQ